MNTKNEKNETQIHYKKWNVNKFNIVKKLILSLIYHWILAEILQKQILRFKFWHGSLDVYFIKWWFLLQQAVEYSSIISWFFLLTYFILSLRPHYIYLNLYFVWDRKKDWKPGEIWCYQRMMKISGLECMK